MEKITPEQFAEKYGQDALNRVRSYKQSSTPSTEGNALSDLKAGFQGAQTAFEDGMTRTAQASQRDTLLGRTTGTLGAGFRFAGEALSSLGSGAFRALPGGTTVADATDKLIGSGVNAGASNPTAQKIAGVAKSGFEALPQGVQDTLGDAGNIVAGGTGIASALVAPGVTSKAVSSVNTAMRSIPAPKITIDTARAGEILNKYRAQLSNIDPQYETILKQQPDASKTMAYFDQAEKGAKDPSQPMATKLASDRAVQAFNSIEAGMEEAGKRKSELLDEIENIKVPGNIAGNTIDTVKETISKRYGIEIDSKGNIAQAKGRMASVDAKSQKLISDYVSLLRQLGPNPTARQLDDFVDATQRMLYKQTSPNLLEVADEPVVAFLKQQTGTVNEQLKTNVDKALKDAGKEGSYSELNQKYSDLIDIKNSLNKRLGAEGDKGASLMKSLFSPQTGEPTRRLFQQIKDETGIDLFEEATLAKFAMESVGDTRSKSLLQQLDALAKDASKVNLMEPGSWLNYLREKADLDGRELAQQIIRQANDGQQ